MYKIPGIIDNYLHETGVISQVMIDVVWHHQLQVQHFPQTACKRAAARYQCQMRTVATSKDVVLGIFSIYQRKLYVIIVNSSELNNSSAKYSLKN